MPSCVFRRCKNYGSKIKKDKGVTYHTFPRDELMKQKWINTVQAERSEYDWLPTKSSAVCSAHFKDTDKYVTSKGYVRLKKTSVPLLFLDPEISRTASPTSLDNEDISDMDSIFDTPRKASLKEQVRKLTDDKQTLQKKNKVLKNQNERLKKKISSLKTIVKYLKKRTIFYNNFYSPTKIDFNNKRSQGKPH